MASLGHHGLIVCWTGPPSTSPTNLNRTCHILPFILTPMKHYSDVIMSAMSFQISIVCSSICSGADQRKLQSSASLAFVLWVHRWLVNSSYERPVTRKMFDDVIMKGLLVIILLTVTSWYFSKASEGHVPIVFSELILISSSMKSCAQ